jgi:hypothetical protein
MWCRARVWSNGDMENCGKQPYAYGKCKEHFDLHRKELEQHKQELIDELCNVNHRLQDMEKTKKIVEKE